LKFTQEREGNTLEAIGISRIQPAQQLREGINKWDYMKFKSCPTKEMVSKLKMLLLYIRQGLITKIYRKFKKLNPSKINDPIKRWATELNRMFSKEEVQ
jgi:hypothetical protein